MPWREKWGKAGSTDTAGRSPRNGFSAKTLQIVNEDPEIYDAADRLIEAADWVVWQLTGVETRNSCTAGYKAIWSKREGFPRPEYFAALNPRMEKVIEEKMTTKIIPIGQRAGGLIDAGCRLDRIEGRHGGCDRQCGCACRGACRDGHRTRAHGDDHGDIHLRYGFGD